METIRHYSMLIGGDWAGQRLRHLGLSPRLERRACELLRSTPPT
jgi:hypothetical protein